MVLAKETYCQNLHEWFSNTLVQDTITTTDSTAINILNYKYDEVYVTVKDTTVSVSTVDTVASEYYNESLGVWLPTGVTNVVTGTLSLYMIPGHNATATYRINYKGSGRLRQRAINNGDTWVRGRGIPVTTHAIKLTN